MTESDAISTLKFAILDAISSTADVTHLRAGSASERLQTAIFESITDSSVRWALKDVYSELEEVRKF